MPIAAAAIIGAGASLLGGSMQSKALERGAEKSAQATLNRHDLRLKRLSFALLV
jgi:hypothetical protein